jgi:hypothetical protein
MNQRKIVSLRPIYAILVAQRVFSVCALLLFLCFASSCAPRKTKTTVDRVYELDPSGGIFIHPKLLVDPPRSLAVLPFRSLVGEGRVEGSQKLLLTLREKKEASPEVLAQEMRLAFFGQLAQLPFEHLHPVHIDARLEAEGLLTWEGLHSRTPEQLGRVLGVEAVIFGEVTHFDYYYAFLYTQLASGLRLSMYSTSTGEALWQYEETRRDHTVRIALEPLSLAVGLFQAGFSLRAINMARAMDEVAREAVAHIPYPKQNLN